ncbi:MAG: ABC transporter permease [Flavobacteriales bacterium]|nr:ABC transporter permease [Flavobacteriales bacterium]
MNLVKISIKNITDKPYQAVLTLIMLIMGVALASLLVLVGGALDDSFKKNIKGIDMVVGAKGSPLQLILSAVYQIDSPTGNISLAEADQLAKNRLVDKTIQLSYGDSYKGRRIIGTSSDYLELYEAQFEEGTIFKESFEAVLGALVAEENDLKIGDEFFSAHGDDETAEIHGDHPFRVTGVLKRSGSVLDKLIITKPESVWEVHSYEGDTSEKDITAMLVTFKNKMGMISLPRMVNKNTSMQAALPAIEINRLLGLFSVGISTLRIVSLVVLILGAVSIFVSMINSLKERSYELALIRSMGATKTQVFSMTVIEAMVLGVLGIVVGLAVSHGGIYVLNQIVTDQFGVSIGLFQLLKGEWIIIVVTLCLCFLAALLPALRTLSMDVSKVLSSHVK